MILRFRLRLRLNSQCNLFQSVFPKNDVDDNRVFINSLGEGMMWVCDKSGQIENGDYITSSNVKGYGALQDDDLLHNYTVGKITQDEDFSDMTEGRYLNQSGEIITEEQYSTDGGFKAKLVGCTYHCG